MADDENRDYPDQYMMRFPRGMRDQLKAAAKENGRALNTEIIARLESIPKLIDRLDELNSKNISLEIKNQNLDITNQDMERELNKLKEKIAELTIKIGDNDRLKKSNDALVIHLMMTLDKEYDVAEKLSKINKDLLAFVSDIIYGKYSGDDHINSIKNDKDLLDRLKNIITK